MDKITFKQKVLIGIVAIVVGALGALLVDMSGGSVQAQTQSQPQESVQTQTQATGWQKRCIDDKKEQCELFQAVIIGDGKQKMRLLDVAISQQSEGDIMLGMTLPLGVTLVQGVALQFDDADAIQMPFLKCHANGCFLLSKITSEILSKFKKGNLLNVYFFDSANKKVKLVLSLDGFTAAFKDL